MDSKLLKKIKRESEKKNKDKNALPSTTLLFNGRYEVLFLIDIRNNSFIYKAFDAKDNKFVIIKEFFPIKFVTELFITRDSDTLDVIENSNKKEYYSKLVDEYLFNIDDEEFLYSSKQISLFKEHNTGYIVYRYNEWPSLQNIIDSGYEFTSEDIHYIYDELFKFINEVRVYKYLNTNNIYVKNSGLIFINNNIDNIYYNNELSLYTNYEQTFFSDEVKNNGHLSKKSDLFSMGAILREIILTLDENRNYEEAIKKVKSNKEIDKFIRNATLDDEIKEDDYAEKEIVENNGYRKLGFKPKHVLSVIAVSIVIGIGVLFTHSVYVDLNEEIPLGHVETVKDIEVENLVVNFGEKLKWNQTQKVNLNYVIIKNDSIEVEIPMYTGDRYVDLDEYKISKGKYDLFFRYKYLDSNKELKFKLVVK